MDGSIMSYVAYCPTGTIFSFGGTSAPNGWLLCDGSAVSRTIYAQLYSAIGSANGSGDGSTTFNIPDLRGRFLRGVAGTATTDPDKTSRIAMNSGGNTGNAVGSVQGLATSIASGTQSGTKSTAGLGSTNSLGNHSHTIDGGGAHSHSITFYGNGTGSGGGVAIGDSPTPFGGTGSTVAVGNHTHSAQNADLTHSHSITGDQETRPLNAYVNYIIKV